ncbi:glycosyltransferase [Thauera sp. ZXT1-4]|uniref:glycosyltransferase n=1 Tax=Thauera sp. ZXT1-4 TaxID=3460294 RepID=UPI004040AE74
MSSRAAVQTGVRGGQGYCAPVVLPINLPTRIYGGMLVVWLLRPALRRRFPLHLGREKDFLDFLAWCVAVGRRQYRLLREIEAWNQELGRPMPMPAVPGCRWQGSFSVAMHLVGLHRAKYWRGQLLCNRKMRHRAARWFFRDGRALLGLPQYPDWQRSALAASFDGPESFVQALLLPKDRQQAEGEQRVRDGVGDLVEGWGSAIKELKTADEMTPPAVGLARRALARMLPVEANEVVSALAAARRYLLPPRRATLGEIGALMEAVSVPHGKSTGDAWRSRPWGVNLIGYARGELGIGEDVRMLARSLEAAGVPFGIVNVELGANVSQADRSVEHWISTEPFYGINIFCMTGIEMARLTLERGAGWLEGHYNIGLWPWELPAWPKPWEHAWSLVDELWGISHYTAAAYGKAPVPVVPMPLPVMLGPIASKSRADWGLPQDAYLFVFSFDMNSTLARKNPTAVIAAFLEAFGAEPDAKVGLVIKVSHLNEKAPAWKAFKAMIRRDARVHLIVGELRRDEVLALYRACDCYVSLHRAEGFGRGLAEAQLLGIDLIATGYSGNMDFCADNATRLVDYRLVAVEEGEYFFGTGQQWADPDVLHAARHMRACVEGAPRTEALDYPVERFSLGFCGQAYSKRLESLRRVDGAAAN